MFNDALKQAPSLQWTLLDRNAFAGGCTLNAMSQAERQTCVAVFHAWPLGGHEAKKQMLAAALRGWRPIGRMRGEDKNSRLRPRSRRAGAPGAASCIRFYPHNESIREVSPVELRGSQ